MSRNALLAHRPSRQLAPLQVCAYYYPFFLSFFKQKMAFTDIYTVEELTRCSLYGLTGFAGNCGIYLGARDRAMLLFSTSIAFRGESACILQWSDLFKSEIPMNEVLDGFRVPVCVFNYL